MTSHSEKSWEWFRGIGSPKYVVAPMVDQSELAFRLLCRRHGATLAVTPMFHSRMFATEPSYRKAFFHTCPEDRPLLVQFCGHDPETMLAAAKHVENDCDGVDINLGCPQGIARRGRYGAYLLKEVDLVASIVRHMSSNLKIPVTCKIRILPTVEATLHLVRTLESAGCTMLTVHGRTLIEKKQQIGPCNWEMIKLIRNTVGIPVVANGGIENLQDIERCLEITQCEGVMTSEAILENAFIFEGKAVCGENQDQIAKEYLEIVKQLMESGQGEREIKYVRAHLFKFLFTAIQKPENAHERAILASTTSFEEMCGVAERIANSRRQFYGSPEDIPESTWYTRHRRNPTFVGSSPPPSPSSASKKEKSFAQGESVEDAMEGSCLFD